MTLRECIHLFVQYKLSFWGTFSIIVVLSILWKVMMPLTYEATVAVNIARDQTQAITMDAYQYDNFYRLQADERFADTVVRWLQSPSVLGDIQIQAQDSDNQSGHWSGSFDARRLSSQFIEVRFDVDNAESANTIAQAMHDALNTRAQSLNVGNSPDGWFVVLVDDPSLGVAGVSWWMLAGVAAFLGIFSGLWVVLLRYFWDEDSSS